MQYDLAGTDDEDVVATLPQILEPRNFAPALRDTLYEANEHEPGRCRADLAAGLTHEDAFVVLCAGREFAPPKGEVLDRPLTSESQEPMVCRSEDGCSTWSRSQSVSYPANVSNAIPFGDVVKLPEGRLGVSCYSMETDGTAPGSTSARTMGVPGGMRG